nr:glycosyltransferase family 4 protein [Nitrosomonas nitrosa]
MMRLAIVTPFPEERQLVRGGVEGVAHCLVAGLMGVVDLDIHIVAPCSRRPQGIERRDGITIHWIWKGRMPGFIGYWSSLRRSIHRRLMDIEPHLTHFQGMAGWTLGYGAPYVFTVHGIAERDILYSGAPLVSLRKAVIGYVERLGRTAAPHTILISPYVAQEIGNHIKGKVWCIENPVTHEFFDLERACDEPVILYVGRVSERKNVEGLLGAFAEIRKSCAGATLRIAGEPDDMKYFQRCMAIVQRSGLDSAVKFLGAVDRPSLLRELSRAACLALISKQETAPMIVEEAMAAGVPVVASRICGLPYMVEDGETGYLVDPASNREIVRALTEIITSQSLASRMGQRARGIALNRFHANAVAAKTLVVYREAMGNTDVVVPQPGQ